MLIFVAGMSEIVDIVDLFESLEPTNSAFTYKVTRKVTEIL